MKKLITLSLLTWVTTSVLCGVTLGSFIAYFEDPPIFIAVPLAIIVSSVAGFPALIVLLASFYFIRYATVDFNKRWQLLILVLLITCIPYGIVLALIQSGQNFRIDILPGFLITTGGLWTLNLFSISIHHGRISNWMAAGPRQPLKSFSFKSIKSTFKMTSDATTGYDVPVLTDEQKAGQPQNKILIKGSITALLILAMLIPASYISKLVDEREERHRDVVKEVSEKWALPQTITTPYLYIPYLKHDINDSGKMITTKSELIIPAKSLDLAATLQPETRKRSIYEVLLYRSTITMKGIITIDSVKGINAADLLLNDASFCSGITDLQGVEEKITATVGNYKYDLQPGLPAHALNASGVSVPVQIQAGDLVQAIPFSLTVKIKGTEKLHFLPLSEESFLSINSSWPSPSFDGKVLPDQHDITQSGFTAKWRFNKANMPLVNQLGKGKENEDKLAFGVSMIQPSDQYAKTNRSVKYAILFIGLSFAMFFITELLQENRVHPVQYVLIGLALVIFYSLLLSIGEFTGFNIAYGIASLATVLLVGLYAVQLFKSLAIGSILGCALGMLYGYIYVLIQLEDTALLAGSVGLFVLLAFAMHFSRKIKWYPKDGLALTV